MMHDPDKLNYREAHAGAKIIKKIYSSRKVWVTKGWYGYEINTACSDGSYHKVIKYKESLEDYIRIHSEN